MQRIISIIFLCILIASFHSCGNLLEQQGIEPTLVQKLRGMWMVGGLSLNRIDYLVGQVDLYDPVTDKWFPAVTTLPTPVSFAGVTSWGGKIYVIGGFDSIGAALGVVQIYNVAADSWTSGSNITGGALRANIDAVAVDGKIYFVGGATASHSTNWAAPTTNQVYQYDTTSDTWSVITTTLATNRSNISLISLSDIVYLQGGRSTATAGLTINEGYSISLNAATLAAEVVLPVARIGFCSVMYTPSSGPTRMIIIGGDNSPLTGVTGNYVYFNINPAAVAATAVNNAYYLNIPFMNTTPGWQSITSTYPLSIAFASAVIYGSSVYCFGGASSFALLSNPSIYNNVYSLELSNLPAGTWELKTAMPFARFGHSAIKIRQ